MPLNKITVKNFQSIPEAEVEIGSFTVFTGPSSSGKSAFMRASAALARNDFTPTQVRQGAKTTTVSMEFDDHTISAERGKSKSTYSLDDEVFTKAGRNVPDPVQSALGMPDIGGVEATFSTQFDKPYLIAGPGAEAASVLGSLTNVSVLHAGIKEANRRDLAVGARIKAEEEHAHDTEVTLRQFEELDAELADLQMISAHLDDLRARAVCIGKQADLLDLIYRNAVALREAQEKVVDLSGLAGAIDQISAKMQRVDGIAQIVREIQNLQAQMPTKTYAGIELIDTSKLKHKAHRLAMLQQHVNQIVTSVKELKQASTKAQDLTTKAEESEADYGRVLVEIGTCPLCGADTAHSSHEGVLHDNG